MDQDKNQTSPKSQNERSEQAGQQDQSGPKPSQVRGRGNETGRNASSRDTSKRDTNRDDMVNDSPDNDERQSER